MAFESFKYVLDASAFYAGTPFLSGAKCATTTAVLDEVKHVRAAATEALIDAGNLAIIDPDDRATEAVTSAARRTGDLPRLSVADISVLALALQLKAVLVSDDYALANVAATIGVRVQMSSGKGLRQVRKYTRYCSACGRAFGPDARECPLCGNALKRKYRSKKEAVSG